MNKGLKNKGLGSWFCLAAALVALITGIVFLSTQATAAPLGHSGTMPGVVLLVGAAASLVFFFVSVPFSAPRRCEILRKSCPRSCPALFLFGWRRLRRAGVARAR